ncbi:Hypothetical predicted protein [Mytilus galloprovincialis]|uniref:Uncharacterized protein n=1 Tax=Mytilus galloprovincialis TaxID=29158 RepID=A0A8B6ELR0_MYTGA|nr:Hypothetical predicted protein [Mytilus galloprovincialis]
MYRKHCTRRDSYKARKDVPDFPGFEPVCFRFTIKHHTYEDSPTPSLSGNQRNRKDSLRKRNPVDFHYGKQTFDDFTVSLEIETKIRNILSDVKVFGTVSIETVPNNEKLINRKSRQAQIITTVVKSFDDIILKQVNTFDSNSRQVTGCIILPDGRMAFTEYGHKRLFIRKADGSPDFHISFKESNAFDCTLVKDATVAVSCGAFGIVCVNGLLVFCGLIPNGIYGIDVNTEQQSKISCTIDVGALSYITYFKNKFYVTNHTNHTVTSFDDKGSVIWAYKDDVNMKTPRGISVDNNGNVFVASERSNNVIMISHDGSRAKQIVDQNNGLFRPCALHSSFFQSTPRS